MLYDPDKVVVNVEFAQSVAIHRSFNSILNLKYMQGKSCNGSILRHKFSTKVGL